MRARSQRLAEIAARAAEGFVVLELKESYGLGFVAAPGRIVSTLHVVSDEQAITAHLSTGSHLKVTAVAGLDVKRDLAVLLAPDLEVGPLITPALRLAEEGTQALTFTLSADGRRTQWIEAKVQAIQVLTDGLTVYRLEGDFPNDLSGAPLVSTRGEALGVVTQAQSDEGLVVLAVPHKYLSPLLSAQTPLPLSVLQLPKKPRRRRLVPQHPVAILDGSSAKGLEHMAAVLSGAINVGSPAFSKGDLDTVYRLYSETAERLVHDRGDCPGPAKALQEGIDRAKQADDVEGRVFALRDAFDALLMLVDKFLKARVAVSRGGGRKSSKLLN